MQFEQVPQLLLGRLLQGSHLGSAGVVDQYVDAIMPGNDLIDDPSGVHVRHVESDGVGLTGIRTDQVIEGRRSTGSGDHDVAGVECGGGDSTPKPATGTGDQPDPGRSLLGLCHEPTHTPAPYCLDNPQCHTCWAPNFSGALDHRRHGGKMCRVTTTDVDRCGA